VAKKNNQMKIYTKTGDKGTTSLLSGERVKKFNLRIDAYGTVDELNSYIGYLRSLKIKSEDKKFLIAIQNKLFNLGALLATKENNTIKIKKISEVDISILEKEIDVINQNIPAIKNFVLPGGSQEVALSHICRTICRRTERLCVELSETETIQNTILTYLNRLSDYFFMLSRKISFDYKVEEIVWLQEN